MRCLYAALLSLLLLACGGGGGGGSSSAEPSISFPLAAATLKDVSSSGANPLGAAVASPTAPATVAAATDATAFMDWAELTFPKLFPSHQRDQQKDGFTYRFYAETATYLGVINGTVRLQGASFGAEVLAVGRLSDFACRVFPEHCAPPTAKVVAPSQVIVGSMVTLDGATSEAANGEGLFYSWALPSKPSGSAAVLSSPLQSKATFIADRVGTYTASLSVTGGTGVSTPVTVTITTVSAVSNVAPVAVAGPSRSVPGGTTVFLDGSGSYDQNGDPLTFTWAIATKPVGSTAALDNVNSGRPSFIADVRGEYVLSLVVSDGKSVSQESTLSLFASNPPTTSPGTGTTTPPPGDTSSTCCKRCTTGKPCGNSCISRTNTCHVGGGCACF